MMRSIIKTFKENTRLRPTPYATGREKFTVDNAKPNTYYSGTVTTPSGKVGVSVRADRSGKGEDFIAAAELTNFHELSDKQQELAIQVSFEIMQRSCGKLNIGSTACVVIASFYPVNDKRVKVTVANLGDSSAYFSKPDSNGNWHTKQLNQLHDCNNPEEIGRISFDRDCKGTIENNRLNGILKTTRGIGDTEQEGLSHTPTFSSGIYSVTDENALIIVASDGLSDGLNEPFQSPPSTEKKIKTSAVTLNLDNTDNFNKLAIEKNISNLLQKKEKSTSEQIAHTLTQQAFAPEPAQDDTSVGIIVIMDILKNLQEETSLSVAVFDGHTIDNTKHDGRDVSRNLSMLFYPLLETVTSQIKNNTTIENEPTISSRTIQKIIAEQTEITIRERQQLFAFRKIYQALYDGQSGLKTSNFLDSPRSLHLLNPKYLENYEAKNSHSRRAKAWQLAKKYYLSLQYHGGTMNVELFKEIYHHSYAKSSILKRSNLSNEMLKQQQFHQNDSTAAISKNFFARTIENIHGFFHSSFKSSTIAAQTPNDEHGTDNSIINNQLYTVLENSKEKEPKTRTDKIVQQFKPQDDSKQYRR